MDGLPQPDNSIRVLEDRKPRVAEKIPSRAEMRLSQNATLYALQTDYTLFTHGPWAAVSGLTHDYLGEFCARPDVNDDKAIFSLFFEKPIFSGFAAVPELGHLLMACETQHWNKLLKELRPMMVFSRDHRYAAKIWSHALGIVDELEAQNRGTCDPNPRIQIVVFGAMTTQGCVYMKPGVSPTFVPKVAIGPADPDFLELSRRVLGDDPNDILQGHRVPVLSTKVRL